MRRRNHIIVFVFFCIAFLSETTGQEEDLGVLFWSKERDLEWSDFKGSSIIDTVDNFYLDLYIQSVNIHAADSYILFGSKPEAYIYTNTSYVDEDLRNDDLLRYLNVYFDLAGYYAYKLDKGLSEARKSKNITIKSNPDIIKNSVIEEWRTESRRLAIETQYGQVIEKLLLWEQEIEVKVKSIKEARLNVSDYAFTFDFQAGGILLENEFSDFLSKATRAVVSLELTKDPLVFGFTATMGNQVVQETFSEGTDLFPVDSEPLLNNLLLNVGYIILENKWMRVIPRGGVHFSQLRYPTDSDLKSINWSTNFSVGLTTDLKLYKWSVKGFKGPELSDISLRIGAFYYPMKLGEANLSHGVLSAGVSWTIGGGKIGY